MTRATTPRMLRPLLISLALAAPLPAAAAVTFGGDAVVALKSAAGPDDGGVTRYPVRVDAIEFEQASTSRPLRLPGTGGAAIDVHMVRVDRRADGLLTWVGRVDTADGPRSVVMTLGKDLAFGLIPQADGTQLRIETRQGQVWLVEGERPVGPLDGADFQIPEKRSPASAERGTRKAGPTPEIDVAVLYNPTLVRVWGSPAAVEARIAQLEAATNQAYADSQVGQRIRVVARQLANHDTNIDNGDALRELTGPASLPIHAEALRVRAQYGADIVMLMRNFDRVAQTSCGNGWLGGYHGSAFDPEDGYNVVADHGFGNDNCGEWTFAHELGHNMGLHHDYETANGDYGAYAYSRGYRQFLDPDSGFHTIMAYRVAPQARLGLFSNPRIADCLGTPCGDATSADNARTLNETAAAVAGLQPAKTPSAGLPGLSVSDASLAEGNSGQAKMRFNITLSAPAPSQVTVDLATMNGSTLNTDLVHGTATAIIPAGQSSTFYDVSVRGDTLPEADEYFALNVTSATGANIVDGQGVGTIVNDDALPTLSVADASIGEGNAGTTPATFTVSLDQPSSAPVTFIAGSFARAPGPTAATEELDFSEVILTGLVIPAGATSTEFTVPVFGDTQAEEDETFVVIVSEVKGAAVGDNIAYGTIVDDDGNGTPSAPHLSINDVQLQEGNAGTTQAVFTISLSAPSEGIVSFSAATADETATAGLDYVARSVSNRQIPAGETSTTLAVTLNGDTTAEPDETFRLALSNVTGATVADALGIGTILNDDAGTPEPAMVARADRAVVRENSPAVAIAVLANDALDTARLVDGSLAIITPPAHGSAMVDKNGSLGTAGDDRILYTPAADYSGDDALVYRACEPGGRCTTAAVQLVVRPHLDARLETTSGAGFSDIDMTGLRALPDARFSATRMTGPISSTEPGLAVDATPQTPWDGAMAGSQTLHFTVAGIPDWIFRTSAGEARLLVDVRSLGGGDTDLYVGVDENGNGQADPSELRCTSAMSATAERCELQVAFGFEEAVPYWVMVHNRSAFAHAAHVDVYEVQLEREPEPDTTATGPGHLARGESFPLRLSWYERGLDWIPGTSQLTFVGVADGPSATPARFPVLIDRLDGENAPMSALEFQQVGYGKLLLPGERYGGLYVDVPAGLLSAQVKVHVATADVDVYLVRAEPDASPTIGPAPDRAQAIRTGHGSQTWSLDGSELTPGRWHLVMTNEGTQMDWALTEVSLFGDGPASAPGSYFNPDRSGHGLFLYPAGDQWAGLWYTYLQDGSPTWYYLQGAAPGSNGIWTAALYRSAWNGAGNHLAEIGRASVTPAGADRLQFTYRLDGETGSETLVALGAGCPSLAGVPQDASSHWFNPSRAGTGYSVQLFPDYEFYAAFVYDGRGVPRFLVAESPVFAGTDATLALEQLSGFCPLCERSGNPARADIGTLQRRFSGGSLSRMALDGIFKGAVPGAWTADEAVQPLGGPGTTQGCAVPGG